MRRTMRIGLLVVLAISLTASPMKALEAGDIDRLEHLILKQQEQIEAQAKAIEALKQQVAELKNASPPKDADSQKETPAEKVAVKPGNSKATLEIYGQVNRGVLVVDDGDETEVYQVDNSNSSTRIGINGYVRPTKELTIGTKIEGEFRSNPSSMVSQLDKRNAGNNNFNKRQLYLFMDHQKYGKFTIGFGSTASDGTAEVDLSGTSVVGYSDVTGMAGGQFFFNDDTDALSGTAIRNVYSNMDGLGRDDMLRYDSPHFYGFQLSTSYIADGGGDLALRYGSKFGALTVASAVAYADPRSASDTMEHQVDGSFSMLHDNGFSVSLAGGIRDHKDTGRDDGTFYYGKLGYQRDIFSCGRTHFSVDYGVFEDINRNGDEADTFGVQMVQNITDWATEYYLGYRHHDLERIGDDYEDINAVLSGFRVKF